jgi:OPT oligopeptide transporter protein
MESKIDYNQASDTPSQEQEATMDQKGFFADANELPGTPETPTDHEEGPDSLVLDNKFPFPPLHGIPEEDHIITFRALIIGAALGAVVSASNIYLGLKTGWTFGASLFGSILGFSILKPLSRYAPKLLGGGYFGPKVGPNDFENLPS